MRILQVNNVSQELACQHTQFTNISISFVYFIVYSLSRNDGKLRWNSRALFSTIVTTYWPVALSYCSISSLCFRMSAAQNTYSLSHSRHIFKSNVKNCQAVINVLSIHSTLIKLGLLQFLNWNWNLVFPPKLQALLQYQKTTIIHTFSTFKNCISKSEHSNFSTSSG